MQVVFMMFILYLIRTVVSVILFGLQNAQSFLLALFCRISFNSLLAQITIRLMTPGNPHADFLCSFSLHIFPPWLSASQIQAAPVALTLFFTVSETTLLRLPLLCAIIWKKVRVIANSPNMFILLSRT